MLTHRFTKIALAGLTALALAGCATHHDRKANNTMIGAGLGAATGAVVSQGNPWYALGGAAAGGLLGNILTEEPRYHRRDWNRGRHHYHSPPHRHVHKRHHHKGHKHHHRRHR